MSKLIARFRSDEAGMTTAEYAVGTVATCGFGGVLWKLLTSETAQGWLQNAVSSAFDFFFGG